MTQSLIQYLDSRVKEGDPIEAGPDDLFPRFDEDTQHKLFERVVDLSRGVNPKGRTAEDLLKLATRLKEPAPSTQVEWMRHLTTFLELVKVDDVTDVTKDDAQQYRDHLLDSCAPSTTKTRLRYVGGMFEVALEEGWLDENPFAGITKRIREKKKPKQVFSLAESDRLIHKLNQTERWLYLIMRYTGLHVSEAAAIRVEDIDLREGVLHIRPNDLRPLKNPYRTRDLPIADKLRSVLEEILATLGVERGHVFPAFYNDAQARWAPALGWVKKIKVSPKACRDNTATILRDAGVNEAVLGRILGHTPKNVTGQYGGVTFEAMAKALAYL